MKKLKVTKILWALLIPVFFFFYFGVNKSHEKTPTDLRHLSATSNSDAFQVPLGHSRNDKEKLWHHAEGAEIFPLRWFLHVNSRHETPSIPSYSTKLYEQLDKKFGIIETNLIEEAYIENPDWVSPMKWIGLTLAWSEPMSSIPQNGVTTDIPGSVKPYSDEEAFAELIKVDQMGFKDVSDQSRFKGIDQIPMVGTNCTLCHSNYIKFKNQDGSLAAPAFIEGAPNMFHARNFFADLLGSTLAVMMVPEKMQNYLTDLTSQELINNNSLRQFMIDQNMTFVSGEPSNNLERNIQHISKKFPEWLRGELGLQETGWNKFKAFMAHNWQSFQTGESIKDITAGRALYENRPILEKAFGMFLSLSYGIPYSRVLSTPTFKARFEWYAMILGKNPRLATTPEGYGRTDAFGRISNAVARGNNELPLIAPVSFPPMWGMQYSNLFHYNGNTNSVIMRNIGQSFGLGAIIYKEKHGVSPDSQGRPLASSNLYNLSQFEKHLYNIEYPEWNRIVPTHLKIDTRIDEHRQLVQEGCNIYLKRCVGCHDSNRRVGKQNSLVKHTLFSLYKAGTDPNHATIQSTPIYVEGRRDIEFRRALFSMTKKIKERFMDEWGVAPQTVEDWENRVHRGQEHFRDTFLGENFRSRNNWLEKEFAIDRPYRGANGKLNYGELSYMKLAYSKDPESPNYGEPVKYKYGYLAKHLSGIWATAPYLHNGSVPTIDHLLNWPSKRPEQFYVGCRVYDPKKLGFVWDKQQLESNNCEVTNFNLFDSNVEIPYPVIINKKRYRVAPYNRKTGFTDDQKYRAYYQSKNVTNGNFNGGHAMGSLEIQNFDNWPGSTISQQITKKSEREALITFLKVLRPSPEYAWSSEAPYEIIGDTCKARVVDLPN